MTNLFDSTRTFCWEPPQGSLHTLPRGAGVVGRPFAGASVLQAGEVAQRIAGCPEEHLPETLSLLDGAFGIVYTRPEAGSVSVVTDRFGVVPMFAGVQGPRVAVGTHPDRVAEALGVESSLDLATMAQAVEMWYASFPHTYYLGVRELAPASIHTWHSDGRHTAQPYWEACYRGADAPGREALAEALASAIENGVRRRVAEAERPGLLLSAGADSRALLFAGIREKPVRTYTFHDVPNAELRLAARLATVAGQEHHPLGRDPEYYGRHARDTTRLIGGMWNALDGHAVGFAHRLAADGIDLLLSGDFADLLFKSAGLDVQRRSLFGRSLVEETLAPFSAQWRPRRIGAAVVWQEAIRERIAAQYAGIEPARLRSAERHDDEAWWHVVHRRVGTLSRTGSVGGPLSLQRALPWDTFMADRAVADAYEQLSVQDRLNGAVWERAVQRLLPLEARRIPNNNTGAPVGASIGRKTYHFLRATARRKITGKEADGTPVGPGHSRGSWPDFAHYLSRSPVVRSLWAPRPGPAADALREVLGYDPWQGELGERILRTGTSFGRVLTLKLWLEQRLRGQSD